MIHRHPLLAAWLLLPIGCIAVSFLFGLAYALMNMLAGPPEFDDDETNLNVRYINRMNGPRTGKGGY